jgi:prepilin-type N-terminal cleavage/methylation domain-containing protein
MSCRSRRTRRTPQHLAAFTLVESLIVVIILGILSAVVLPRIGSQRSEAVASTLQANVTQVVMLLEHQKQKSTDGSYPAAIDPEWFVNSHLPMHPDQMAGVPAVETVVVAGLLHPRSKLVQPGAAGAYWYNASAGVFRARVKSQGSAAATQALYDLVNGTSSSGAQAASAGSASAAAVDR